MGGSNNKYIKSFEDQVESCIKTDKNLKDIKSLETFTSNADLFEIRFKPNNWNIFHLSCWYGNLQLLFDLVKLKEFKREIVDEPDKNGEPAIVLACVLDQLNIVKYLIETVKCLTKFDKNEDIYSLGLSLESICVEHDSVNCFIYLNPDLTLEEERLDILYDLAKNKNSEAIVRAFEKDLFDDIEYDIGLFAGNEPHVINL